MYIAQINHVPANHFHNALRTVARHVQVRVRFLHHIFRQATITRGHKGHRGHQVIKVLTVGRLVRILVRLFADMVVTRRHPFQRRLVNARQTKQQHRDKDHLRKGRNFARRIQDTNSAKARQARVRQFIVFRDKRGQHTNRFNDNNTALASGHRRGATMYTGGRVFSTRVTRHLAHGRQDQDKAHFQYTTGHRAVRVPAPAGRVRRQNSTVVHGEDRRTFRDRPFSN